MFVHVAHVIRGKEEGHLGAVCAHGAQDHGLACVVVVCHYVAR